MSARKIRVEVTRADPHAMYLRTGIADGVLENGRPVEISISGSKLLLAVGKYGDADRVVETLDIVSLISSWAAKL